MPAPKASAKKASAGRAAGVLMPCRTCGADRPRASTPKRTPHCGSCKLGWSRLVKKARTTNTTAHLQEIREFAFLAKQLMMEFQACPAGRVFSIFDFYISNMTPLPGGARAVAGLVPSAVPPATPPAPSSSSSQALAVPAPFPPPPPHNSSLDGDDDESDSRGSSMPRDRRQRRRGNDDDDDSDEVTVHVTVKRRRRN